VRAKQNIMVSGGTGSGKTTLLNVLSLFIPRGERVVTIEDSAELKLTHRNLVRLEARPANIEGKGRIGIRDLVVNALRMRPDRIIVGECRSAEALDMLQAMNTGHDGSLTSIHANNPRDALSRLENMVMMAGFELPSKAIREQITSAVNLIVQQSRMMDGSRRIVQISEVTGREEDTILVQDIFVYEQEGFDEAGRIVGRFQATGNIPRFVEELRQKGNLRLEMSVFVPRH
jgi:pilus assembly protein CpaF